jgi:hypothetical protein
MPEKSDEPFLFLSHAGADTVAARELKARIERSPEGRARSLRVWFDKDDLLAGEGWQAQLEEAVSRASAFAVYIGSKGIVNWVDAEVRLALSRALGGDRSFRFIPILAAAAGGPEALPGFAHGTRIACCRQMRT